MIIRKYFHNIDTIKELIIRSLIWKTINSIMIEIQILEWKDNFYDNVYCLRWSCGDPKEGSRWPARTRTIEGTGKLYTIQIINSLMVL